MVEGIDPATAKQECDELASDKKLPQGACIPLTIYLNNVAQNNGRVLLWAKEPGDITVIVEAYVDDNGMPAGDDPAGIGSVALANEDGATTLSRVLKDTMIGPGFGSVQRMQSQ